MKVIPLKFYDGGFMTQAFAMGGEQEKKDEAIKTLNRAREFMKENKVIYCSTHCPEGYLNVENKNICKIK